MGKDKDHHGGGDHDHRHDKEKLLEDRRVLKAQKRQHGKPNNEYKKGHPKNRP